VNRFSSDDLPKPDEFPLGSPESRTAARAMLEAQERDVRRVQIILDVPRPQHESEPETIVGPWYKTADGTHARYSETKESLSNACGLADTALPII
jgi:hypothetical protein